MCAAKTFGSIQEFNEDGDWETYLDRIEQFFAANEISNADQQRAIFLTCCGDYLYGLLCSIISPQKPKELNISVIFEKIGTHLKPKPSPIVSRCTFNRTTRNPNESVSDFSNRLRKLANLCDYGPFLDDMLRDRFICGINDNRIQRRLFSEETGLSLTFKKVFDIALAIETANRNLEAISNQPHEQHALTDTNNKSVNYIKPKTSQQKFPKALSKSSTNTAPPNKTSYNGNCAGCGGQHPRAKCKFKNANCYTCGIKGHLASVCRSKGKTDIKNKRRNDGNLSTIHCESLEEIAINSIKFHDEQPFNQELMLNDHMVSFEVDTGSPKTIINEQTFNLIANHNQLRPTSIILRTYTKDIIPLVGELQVNATFQDKTKSLNLIVVRGKDKSNLLGRDWLREFPEILKEDNKTSENSVNKQNLEPNLMSTFAELFNDDQGGSDITVSLQLKDNAISKYMKARQVPLALRQKVEDEIYRLERQGIIQSVRSSNWATPVVPVIKPDGTVRLCGDYKVTLNPSINIDKHPLPRLEEIRAKLGGSTILSKLDLSHAYLQLKLDPESQDLTTINTHLGLYKYLRLPFGIASAPAIFQRQIDSITRDIPKVAALLDDIIIGGSDEKEHDENLRRVFERLQQFRLKLNKQKCIFKVNKLTYLGYEFIGDSIAPTTDKFEAIQSAPAPQNQTQLKSFLGLINYYAHFIPNISTILAPLYELLKKDVKWRWGEREIQAFQEAKLQLKSDRILIGFNPDLPIFVTCDASQYGIGAVLEHEIDGKRRPIWFASRVLSPSERNYSQLEKEALAIVFAIKKFHFYLYGRRFHVETDHKPLATIFGDKALTDQASPRVIRWRLFLNGYSFTISYKSGSHIAHADALSRLPSKNASTEPEVIICMLHESIQFVKLNQIKDWTRRDNMLSDVMNYLKNGWPTQISEELLPFYHRRDELSIIQECVYWGNRVVIPQAGRSKTLSLLHHEHPGIVKMKALARGYVWWPNIDKDIENNVRSCMTCQLQAPVLPKVPIEPRTWPHIPWRHLYMDITYCKGYSFLIIIDACSKWLEVIELARITSEAIIKELRRLFATFGLPEEITTDNQSIFISQEIRAFANSNCVHLRCIPPYHPASNGMAERAGRTFKASFRKKGPESVHLKIARFLFHYRTTPHSSTGETPANMMFRHPPRTVLDLMKPTEFNRVQHRGKQNADRHSRERIFQIGDRVLVQTGANSRNRIPGRITKATSPVTYEIYTEDGRAVHRHADHIRPINDETHE